VPTSCDSAVKEVRAADPTTGFSVKPSQLVLSRAVPLKCAGSMNTTTPAPSASHAAGVHLQRVSRVFEGGVEAVRAMDLTIAAGEFVALIGPSGCGKSTLLRIIAGLDRATSGVVEINGKRNGRAARARVAFVFQDAHLLPWRNVLGNVMLPLELQHVPTEQRRGRAMTAIEQVGLADAIGRYPAALSGGMRMRVSLARALVTDPELLLLDEPFAALDEITRQQLDEQLRELWTRRGMTVLFVTHSINEAAFLADRAVVFTKRPARIVIDHLFDLPAARTVELRADAQFAKQTGVLLEALKRGGSFE
jgi:NitT/TauT family transport system ATP-binding protein